MESRVEIRPGRNINIRIHQHPTKTATAFLLHGLGGRGDQWREQINFLQENYTLIIPDLLGQGSSERPPFDTYNPYSFTEIAQDIDALFQRYATQTNIVLGHSYGGAFATALAFQHQDRIQKLILITPVACSPIRVMPFFYRLPTFAMELARKMMLWQFKKLVFTPQSDPALVKVEANALKENSLNIIKALIHGMQDIPAIDATTLHVPTLIIVGELDKLVSPQSQIIFYKNLPHHEFKTFANTSHLLLLENPTLVNPAIAEFLAKV